jgi:hypothetical protein
MTNPDPAILFLPAAELADVLASVLPCASKNRTFPELCNVQLRVTPDAEGTATLMAVATDRYVLGYCRRTIKVDGLHEATVVLLDAVFVKDLIAMIRKTKTAMVRMWIEGGRVDFQDGAGETGLGARIYVDKGFPAVDSIMETGLDADAVRSTPFSFDLAKLAQFSAAAKVAKTHPVFWSGLDKSGRERMTTVRIGPDFAGGVMPVRLPEHAGTDTARTYADGFSL